MELQGDVGLVENSFSLFQYDVSVSARKVHALRKMYHGLRNHLGRTRWHS
jgi:hypothetical protein